MSNPIDRDDERWLDALAGKPAGERDDPSSLEALAVRRALQARAQRLAADVPEADDALLEQLRFRLRRERLSGTKTVLRRPVTWALAASVLLGIGLAVRIGGIDDRQPDPTIVDLPVPPLSTVESEPAGQPPLVAATLVASSDPEARAKQLIGGMPIKADAPPAEGGGGLVGASVRPAWLERFSWTEARRSFEGLSGLFRDQVRSGVPVVIELGQDQIMLVIEATEAMIKYLRSQDIEPTVTDGEIVILIHGVETPAPPEIEP